MASSENNLDSFLNLPENFLEIYVPYVTTLLLLNPKNTYDIYRISTAYFENKLKERQMTDYKSLKNLECRRSPEETKDSMESIPGEADFIYDSVVELPPTQVNSNKTEFRLINKSDVIHDSEENRVERPLMEQLQILNIATERLHLDFVRILNNFTQKKTEVKRGEVLLSDDSKIHTGRKGFFSHDITQQNMPKNISVRKEGNTTKQFNSSILNQTEGTEITTTFNCYYRSRQLFDYTEKVKNQYKELDMLTESIKIKLTDKDNKQEISNPYKSSKSFRIIPIFYSDHVESNGEQEKSEIPMFRHTETPQKSTISGLLDIDVNTEEFLELTPKPNEAPTYMDSKLPSNVLDKDLVKMDIVHQNEESFSNEIKKESGTISTV